METKSEYREEKNFDDVLKIVGDNGRFQAMVYFFYFVLEAAAAAIMYSFVFDSINPGGYCPISNSTGHHSNSSFANITNDACNSDGYPCTNFSFIGTRKTIVTEFGLICGEAYTIKLVQSIGFIGVLCGAATSQLSDLYGRKKVLTFMWLGLMISGTCQRFAINLPMYIALRFLACLFSGAQLTITSCYALEFFGPMWRSIAGFRIGFQSGELVLDLCAFLLMDWKDCMVAISLYTAPFFPLFLFLLPESPRWLIQKGKLSDAQKALAKIAKFNRKLPPSADELQKISLLKSDPIVKYNLIHLYSTKSLAKKTLVTQICWFALGCFSTGIASQMTTLAGSVYVTFAISRCLTLATRWLVIFLLNSFGRKKTYMASWVAMIVLLSTALTLDFIGVSDGNRLPVSYLVAVTDTVSNYGWSSIVVLSAELFPTLLRNVGIAAGTLASRFGSILAPQIAALEFLHKSAPFVIYIVQGIISMILLGVFIDETSNQPLPEELPPAKLQCCSCKRSDSSSSIDKKENIELSAN